MNNHRRLCRLLLFTGVALTTLCVTTVQATNFFIGVDPVTGEISLFVNAAGNREDRSGRELYPSTQLYVDPTNSSSDTDDYSTYDNIADLDALLANTSSSIIEAIIKSKMMMEEENKAYIEKMGTSAADIERVNQAVDTLIENIVANATAQGIVDESQIRPEIDKINEQLDNKVDLDNVRPEKLSSEARQKQLELLARQQQQRQQQLAQRQQQEQQQEQLRQRLEELQQQEEAAGGDRERQAQLRAERTAAAHEARQKALKQTAEDHGAVLDEIESNQLLGTRPDPHAPVTPESLAKASANIAGAPSPQEISTALSDTRETPLGPDIAASDTGLDHQRETWVEESLADAPPPGSDFPHFESGHITHRDQWPTGMEAVYTGVVSGLHNDEHTITGRLEMAIDFNQQQSGYGPATAQIQFDNGLGEVRADMALTPNGLFQNGDMSGDFAGNALTGENYFSDINFYGPAAEEVGGNWQLATEYDRAHGDFNGAR